MALFYQMRSKDSAAAAVKSRPNITQCKRHPKHQQSPGVCSLCLQEKLSKLSSGSSSSSSFSSASFFPSRVRFRRQYYYYYSSGSSSSSSLSSSSGSSMPSPDHQYRFDGMDLLVKSRSIAFVPRRRARRMGHGGNNGNDDKRIGFWSRLISGRRGAKTSNNVVEESGLKYSKTVRER